MLNYRVQKLVAWPGKRLHDSARKDAQFKMNWTKIMNMLGREIDQLGGKNVVFFFEIINEARDIRRDGGLREDAKVAGPAAIVEVTAEGVDGHPRLTYACDTYRVLAHNLRAIAGILEALRTVERYGGNTGGKQYQGFKALPAQTATTLSVHAAAEIIARESGGSHQAVNILNSKAIFVEGLRAARSRAHPDKNAGKSDLWDAVERARVVLEGYHANR